MRVRRNGAAARKITCSTLAAPSENVSLLLRSCDERRAPRVYSASGYHNRETSQSVWPADSFPTRSPPSRLGFLWAIHSPSTGCFVVVAACTGHLVLRDFVGRTLRGGRPDRQRKDASLPCSARATFEVSFWRLQRDAMRCSGPGSCAYLPLRVAG